MRGDGDGYMKGKHTQDSETRLPGLVHPFPPETAKLLSVTLTFVTHS